MKSKTTCVLNITQFILLCLITSVGTNLNQTRKYKVYDVKLNTRKAYSLQKFVEDKGIDRFHLVKGERTGRFGVSSDKQDFFEQSLKNMRFSYHAIKLDPQFAKSLTDDPNYRMDPDNIILSKYHKTADINTYLDNLAKKYSDVVTVSIAGTSTEGRPIKTILISQAHGDHTRKVIFIDAGMHAREWATHTTALYIIHELVENSKSNEKLLMEYDWLIMSMANPDGYEYSRNEEFFWRKTRSFYEGCYGADINRNFDYFWGGQGASDRSCHPTFRGRKPFSEPESRAIRDSLLSIKGRCILYLSLHMYGKYILHPWGYSSKSPPNLCKLRQLGNVAVDAMFRATGYSWKVGSPPEVMYHSSGCSFDYAMGKANVSYAFAMELRQGGITGFHAPPHALPDIASEAWTGIKAMVGAINMPEPSCNKYFKESIAGGYIQSRQNILILLLGTFKTCISGDLF